MRPTLLSTARRSEPSLHRCEQWLAFFDDVGGELRPVARTDVLRRMRCSSRDKKDVASLDRYLLAANLVFERTFDNVDDFFARMRVHRGGVPRIEVNAYLHDLASGCAEV